MTDKPIGGTLKLIIIILALVLAPAAVHAQDAIPARVGFFEDYDIQPGERVEVPVEVRDVQDLYGVDLEIRFDPAILAVEDANPDQPGVQPALGTFLDAGLTLFNEVDNDEGLVRFVMTQVNPSEPKSGDGVLLVLYFVGLQEGVSDLTVEFVELAARTGEGIEAEGSDAVLTVSADAEQRERTPIPVQDPTLIIIIPTLAPTATPTPEPTPTPQPEPTATEEPEAVLGEAEGEPGDPAEADEAQESPEVDEEAPASGFSILQYWWAVLLVVLAAVGLAVYLLKTKKVTG